MELSFEITQNPVNETVFSNSTWNSEENWTVSDRIIPFVNNTKDETGIFPSVKHSGIVIGIYVTVYMMIFLLSCVGNILVIVVICRFRYLHSVTNFCIANLAIADTLVAIFCIPITLLTNIFTGIRHVRRIPHPGRGVGGTRTRRANMHFSSGASNLAGLSPGNRDTMDPIAELLSQLSSVRSRAAAAQSVSSQLQQLEMQLQSTRQQLERLPNRRQVDASKNNAANSSSSGSNTENQNKQTDSSGSSTPSSNSPYLLAKCTDSSENLEQTTGKEKMSRSFFIQELLLSTLTEQLNSQGNMDELASVSEVLSISPAPSEGNGSGCLDSTSHNSNAQSKVAVRPTTPEKSNQASPAKSQTPVGGGSGGGGQGHPVRNHGYSQIGSTTPIRQNHASHSQLYNSLPGSSAVLGGASFGAGNPHPLPGRPGAGARDRDSRVNPAAAKKSMFKQLPASQKSDREPPPH